MDDNALTWKPGIPPGDYYEGMTKDYEVHFSPIGMVWHRRVRGPGKETVNQ